MFDHVVDDMEATSSIKFTPSQVRESGTPYEISATSDQDDITDNDIDNVLQIGIMAHPTPDTRHPTPDTRHPTPDTRHPTPDTQYKSIKHKIIVKECK